MKLTNVLMALVSCLIFSFAVKGQYFTLPGAHFYALNSSHQVFDVSPDGKIGISLRNDPVNTHPAILTTFDPILGTQMDSKTFGFGPLEVNLSQVGNSLRAVVLTSEGGPRRIYLFDVSSTGQLTQLGSTQLTTSNSDGGSNLVLSGSAQAGFVIVYTSSAADLVTFSLVDGAILNRLQVPNIPNTLAMSEGTNRRLLAFRNGNSLKVMNAINPVQPMDLGNVPLVSNGEFSGSFDDGIAFSTDGRYVFLGNQFFNFAAIDLNVLQVVGTIPGNYRFGRVRIFENNQQRLLAVQSTPAGTGGVSAILLVDATDPSHLSIVNQYNPLSSETFFYKSDFAFSHDGARLYAAPKEKLIAFDLPTFNKAWEQPVPGSVLQVHQLKVYGPNDEVLGAWDVSGGLGFTSIFGAFPAFPPNISVNESTTVTEGTDTAANFTISLSAATSHRVTVNYTTADGTAQKGLDYTATSGAMTFEPGVTTRAVSVPIIDDNIDEFDQTFTFNISNPTVGSITRAQSTATILEDVDPPPSVSISDVSVNKGNSGTRNAIFLVSLSTASGKPISLNYATADGTATAGDDYSSAIGTVNFSPGQITKNIVIVVKGDTLNEGDETFFVNLTNPVNVTITKAQGVGTILDDNPPILATEQNSQRAIALDSVTFLRDPFAVTNLNYFGTDQRTRISIFTTNVILTPGLVVTVQAEDSQHIVYQLPVEFVASVPQFSWLMQVSVKLPDGIVSPGDLQVSITVRGKTSNKVLVGVRP